MNQDPIIDPYRGMDEDSKVRLQSRIGKDDYNFLRTLMPTAGAVQLTVNWLVRHFINTAKKHGIQCYTEFDKFADLLRTNYPPGGLAPVGVAEKASDRDDRRGTKKHGRRVATKSNVTSNASVEPHD